MGCDIHVHTEVKINGEWHHLGNPNVSRYYALFAKMAGVRNYDGIDPIAQPRGLPTDATFLTRFDAEKHWESDGHSHSWLGAEEIGILEAWYVEECKKHSPDGYHYIEQEFGYLFSSSWDGFMKYPQENRLGIEDARWIFWFDN